MKKIAVLGCGRIGVMHAANIAAHPRVSLAGVYDLAPSSAEAVASCHNVKQFNSADEVFTDSNVDAVLVASPTSTHVDFIEQSVNSGKPVLCEKPIDLSSERVNELKKRITGKDIPIMLGFVRRFDAGHAAAQKAAASGELGELHQVIITSRDPGMAPDGYIETSGGIFRDMTIHDLDLARFMLNEPVVAVSAHGSRKVDAALMERCNDYDTIVVTLISASGKQAVITNSRCAVYGYDQRVELFGSAGMIISDNHTENRTKKYSAAATAINPPLQHFFIERYADAFNAEIDHFADVIENNTPVAVGFEDGRIALQLADACYESISKGKTIDISQMA
ncbi:MAG: inositol 2-dehydrogenase [Granulosicoccus sp.]|nr:inositol 2-dehydrogenase [Granulosicoccus sp.]